MPKNKRKPTEKWNHPAYRHCYAFNRNGVVYFSINSRRIVCKPQITFEPKNKTLALRYLDVYAKQLLDGVLEDPKTLFQLLEYYHSSQFKTLKANSQQIITYTLGKYIKSDYNLSNLLQFKSDLLQRLDNSELTNNTKNNVLSSIRLILNYGVKIGWLKENVLNGIKYRKDATKELNYTFEDYEILIQHLATKDINAVRLIKFLRHSGCRINEAITLKTSSLLDNKIEIVGKGDRIRYIYNQFIDEYDFIFPNKQVVWDFNANSFKALIHYYCKGNNLKWYGFHTLRKLRETELIDKYNLPDNLVAEILGHTLEVQAKTYRQMRNEKDKEKFANLYVEQSKNA